MATTSATAPVRFNLRLTDASGAPLLGARVTFRTENSYLGRVQNSPAAISLELDADGDWAHSLTVTAEAELFGVVRVSSLLSGATQTLALPTQGVGFAGPPTAYCPDGTAGQPCVDCIIGALKVRICV